MGPKFHFLVHSKPLTSHSSGIQAPSSLCISHLCALHPQPTNWAFYGLITACDRNISTNRVLGTDIKGTSTKGMFIRMLRADKPECLST